MILTYRIKYKITLSRGLEPAVLKQPKVTFYNYMIFFFISILRSAKMQNPETIGTWNPVQKMQFSADFKNITLPKLFRVGMTPSKPWMYFELDPRTNEKLKAQCIY